jgi:hypothetical protein
MRLQTGALAITGAVVALFAYLLGAIINLLSPWGALTLVAYIYRVDLENLARPFAWDGFVVGVVSVGLFGALLGAVAARMYNAVVDGAFSRLATRNAAST